MQSIIDIVVWGKVLMTLKSATVGSARDTDGPVTDGEIQTKQPRLAVISPHIGSA